MDADPTSARSWRNPHHTGSAGADAVGRSLLLGRQLRARVNTGAALGTFVIDLPDAATVTAVSVAGFDFAVLCMEHSATDFGRLEHLIDAARAANLPVLVRPWSDDRGLIGKILDLGAHGIMVPHVGSATRAREIVGQARFAPRGERGYSPLGKFDALETPLTELDDAVYVVVQIEGRDAIEHVDEIAGIDGIDAIFVGPYDLALSLDVPPGSGAVVEAAASIAATVRDRAALGIYVDEPASCGHWRARGFALQCVSFDGRMLADMAQAVLREARRVVDAGPAGSPG